MIFKGEDPNMRQFGALTKYLPLIELDEIGHWYIDTEMMARSIIPMLFCQTWSGS